MRSRSLIGRVMADMNDELREMNINAEKSKTERLEGDTVYLRVMTPEDTDLIVKWRNEDFVRENFIYQKPFTREGHLNWIKTQIEPGHVVQFMICRKADDRPVGSVYFRDIDREHKRAEYGIFIGEKEALGQGIGTQAAVLAVRYGFSKLKLHKIMLRVLAGNPRAKRSYEKAGFAEEGRFREHVFLNGRFQDVIFMGMLNPDETKESPNQSGAE